MNEWPAGHHLCAIYVALYRSLGEGAPHVTRDGFVVRLHEASRTFGALALELSDDDEDVAADPLVATVMTSALANDDTGALALYALSVVVGPRLLVTLRDYLQNEADPRRRALLSHGSDLVVREMWALGAAVGTSDAPDDPAWARAARALVEAFDAAGMAESLGQRL